MKFLSIMFFLLIPVAAFGQPDRIGAGLSFANVLEFNGGETNNPGLHLKTWIALDKNRRLHIVPSVTPYYRYKYNLTYLLKNYMFQGDVDGQYVVFKEKTVRVVGFAGVNFTYLYSLFESNFTGPGAIESTSTSDWAVGGNVGAGLELRMAGKWDLNVSGKYKFSKYNQFIISIGTAYNFGKSRRTYRR